VFIAGTLTKFDLNWLSGTAVDPSCLVWDILNRVSWYQKNYTRILHEVLVGYPDRKTRMAILPDIFCRAPTLHLNRENHGQFSPWFCAQRLGSLEQSECFISDLKLLDVVAWIFEASLAVKTSNILETGQKLAMNHHSLPSALKIYSPESLKPTLVWIAPVHLVLFSGNERFVCVWNNVAFWS
jgi:hypothetical protein